MVGTKTMVLNSYNHGLKWSYNHGFISWHQFKEHLQVVCMLRVPLFETLDSKIRNFQVKTFWQGKYIHCNTFTNNLLYVSHD